VPATVMRSILKRINQYCMKWIDATMRHGFFKVISASSADMSNLELRIIFKLLQILWIFEEMHDSIFVRLEIILINLEIIHTGESIVCFWLQEPSNDIQALRKFRPTSSNRLCWELHLLILYE
jgi:hypothetical protein